MNNHEQCIELLEELLKYDILRYQHQQQAEELVTEYRENDGRMSLDEFMDYPLEKLETLTIKPDYGKIAADERKKEFGEMFKGFGRVK